MSTFLGIGFGPIQTGIFVPGAMRGGFSRIVVADVDKDLVDCVRANDGKVRINVAHADRIEPVTLAGIEILNPLDDGDRARLVEAVAEADEIATALPSVAFYRHISGWLGEGLAANPAKSRLVYASENHNHAAELLAEAVAQPAVAAQLQRLRH